jgi:site-specific recombinase XerD
LRNLPPVSPHVFRHSAAVSLLESGVDVNVIRAWLGHVSLETTNRYAEISIKMKEKALQACEPITEAGKHRDNLVWRDDLALCNWLQSL